MGAVAVVIVGRGTAVTGVEPVASEPPVEGRVVRIHAGIQLADDDAFAGVSCVPGVIGVDDADVPARSGSCRVGGIHRGFVHQMELGLLFNVPHGGQLGQLQDAGLGGPHPDGVHHPVGLVLQDVLADGRVEVTQDGALGPIGEVLEVIHPLLLGGEHRLEAAVFRLFLGEHEHPQGFVVAEGLEFLGQVRRQNPGHQGTRCQKQRTQVLHTHLLQKALVA